MCNVCHRSSQKVCILNFKLFSILEKIFFNKLTNGLKVSFHQSVKANSVKDQRKYRLNQYILFMLRKVIKPKMEKIMVFISTTKSIRSQDPFIKFHLLNHIGVVIRAREERTYLKSFVPFAKITHWKIVHRNATSSAQSKNPLRKYLQN